MRKIAPDYSLQLTFVGSGGEYLADIDTRILAVNGALVLAVVSEGPLLCVRLPSGNYRVSASYNGVVRQSMITVPAHHTVARTVIWPRRTTRRTSRHRSSFTLQVVSSQQL